MITDDSKTKARVRKATQSEEMVETDGWKQLVVDLKAVEADCREELAVIDATDTFGIVRLQAMIEAMQIVRENPENALEFLTKYRLEKAKK